MKTPYSHAPDISISRELNRDLILDVAYVAKFARRLAEQEDVGMPLNLVASKSGTDYFTAATALSKLAHAGVPVQMCRRWLMGENLFGPLAGGG